jgi:hypothetical protein
VEVEESDGLRLRTYLAPVISLNSVMIAASRLAAALDLDYSIQLS